MKNMTVVTTENKEKALAHNSVGYDFMQQKSYSLAKNEFCNAVACDPTLAKAYFNIGIVHTYEHQDGEAETFFLKAQELWKNQNELKYVSDCLNEISLIYYRKKEYQNAIIHINTAISLNANNGHLFRHRGEYYQRKGQADLAIVDFKEAVRLNSKDTKARTHLGVCYHSMKEYDKAKVEYSEVIQIDPNASATSHYNLAKIYAKNPDEIFNAINHYHWAGKLNPTFLKEAKNGLEKCLDNKSKNDIFVGIKTLPKSQQFQLLTDIRNKIGLLGELFWEKRFFEDGLSSCSLKKGALKEINDCLDVGALFKMAVAVICRGFFKDKNNPPLPLDMVKVVFKKVPQGLITEDPDEIVQERHDTGGFKKT